MKTYKNYIILVLIVLSGLSIPNFSHAQSQQAGKVSAKLLVGTWNLDYETSLGKMRTNIRIKYDRLNAEHKSQIAEAHQGQQFILNGDGSYTLVLRQGQSFDGTWKMAANDKGFILTNAEGNDRLFRIASISESKMVLKPKVDNEDALLLSELHLTRQ